MVLLILPSEALLAIRCIQYSGPAQQPCCIWTTCKQLCLCDRSVAFQQAGWSPEYTLTEDYALGMELTKRNWYCRYVEEYLAIGEAPEQVRNCFQQRSRWCKVRAMYFGAPCTHSCMASSQSAAAISEYDIPRCTVSTAAAPASASNHTCSNGHNMLNAKP